MVFEKVKKMLADQLDADENELTMETNIAIVWMLWNCL